MSERFVVVWRVTTRCNLACPYCAYDRHLPVARREADTDLIARTGPMLAEWSRQTGRPTLVSWLGGEALLWAPLAAFSAEYDRLGLQLSTTTNGTPLASLAVREHLLAHYSELTISIDALGSEHDELRGQRGLFTQVKESVRELASAIGDGRLRLRVNVVLMRGTIDRFPQLCRELATWGIHEITTNQLGGVDRPEFFPANRLLPSQVERLRESWDDLRDELASTGVRLLGSQAYLRRMEASARDERVAISDCAPGQRFVFIDETGRIAPCSFTGAEYGVPLAESEWPALRNRFSTARSCQRSAACDDCRSTQVFQKFASQP